MHYLINNLKQEQKRTSTFDVQHGHGCWTTLIRSAENSDHMFCTSHKHRTSTSKALHSQGTKQHLTISQFRTIQVIAQNIMHLVLSEQCGLRLIHELAVPHPCVLLEAGIIYYIKYIILACRCHPYVYRLQL